MTTQTLQVIDDSYLAALADLRRIGAELGDRRRAVARGVDRLLDGGWSGAAADVFTEGWAEWTHGADDVLAGLAELTDLMVAFRAEILAGDERIGDGLDRLGRTVAGMAVPMAAGGAR